MRPHLLQPRTERQSSRRSSRRRAARVPAARSDGAAIQAASEAMQAPPVADGEVDPAVQRVREAGGPVDRACYSCHCGFVFEAKVSTTVRCPHCGAGQAW